MRKKDLSIIFSDITLLVSGRLVIQAAAVNMSPLLFALLVATCIATEGTVVSHVERPVEPRFESLYGIFRHRSGGKYIHPKDYSGCPPDGHNLLFYYYLHLDGRISFRFVQVIGHYGYLEHTCESVFYPVGGSLNPGDGTRLVLNQTRNAAALFTIDEDGLNIIHHSGLIASPASGSNNPYDEEDVALHQDMGTASRFEFLDLDTLRVQPVFPHPLILGYWKLIHAVMKPIEDYEYNLAYGIGKSISKQASQDFEWIVSAQRCRTWFENSEYSEFVARTELATWEAESTRILNIKVPAGTSLVTWQYFFEAEQFEDGFFFRSTIIEYNDDPTQPPELSKGLSSAKELK